MEREEIKSLVIESLNSLSFEDTNLLMTAIKDGFYPCGDVDYNKYIEYCTDCYCGVADTPEQMRKAIADERREDMMEIIDFYGTDRIL